MMFLMLPSHSAQIFPFLKYPMAQEPQYGPACDKECPPRRLAQGGREKNSRNQLKRKAWYLRMRFRIRCKGLWSDHRGSVPKLAGCKVEPISHPAHTPEPSGAVAPLSQRLNHAL